jgi:hypothetical protein
MIIASLLAAVVTASCVGVAAAGDGRLADHRAPGVLFDGAFESGSYRPWLPQAANYGYADNAQVHFGRFSLTVRNPGQGRYGGRFDLPAWSLGRTRAQLITSRPVNAGGDDWYSLMLYVPRGWSPGTTDFWGVSIAELNFQGLGTGGPTIALQAHADHVTVAMQTGVATTADYQYRSNADSGGRPNLPPLYAIPRPMRLGVWHELVIHVHWAVDRHGVVAVWHRLKGETRWRKTASLAGVPTLQTNPDGSFPRSTLDVLQAYRGPSFAPTTIWMDGFSRAVSFKAAAVTLP